MNYVGIDIGSTASKVVALGDENIEFVLPTGLMYVTIIQK